MEQNFSAHSAQGAAKEEIVDVDDVILTQSPGRQRKGL